jgi:CheY-like chemotaxis protein
MALGQQPISLAELPNDLLRGVASSLHEVLLPIGAIGLSDQVDQEPGAGHRVASLYPDSDDPQPGGAVAPRIGPHRLRSGWWRMHWRWLVAGPLVGAGAIAGVIAGLPNTRDRAWWVAAGGIGAGLSALIGLLPSREHARSPLTFGRIHAERMELHGSSTAASREDPASAEVSAEHLQQSTRGLNIESTLPGGEPRLVLWVDDRPINNAWLIESLRHSGIEVALAYSTDEAITLVRHNPNSVALVISDMARNERGAHQPTAGLKLISRLRELGLAVPIIIYTGEANVASYGNQITKRGGNVATHSPAELLNYLRAHGLGPML